VPSIDPPALAVRDVPAQIQKMVEGRQASRKKHDVVALKQKLEGSMRALQETQDLVAKLRNANAELGAIINDLQNEIAHLRGQLHETRIAVQRLKMEVPTGIGPVKSAVLQDRINNSGQREKTQRRWNPITTCLAYACLTTCPAAYRLFKGMALLPSVSLLSDKFQGVVAE
jgi:hypothetical protein